MLFPTVQFGIFFVLVFSIAWYMEPLHQDRKVFLLLASYFFYASLDLKYLPLLIAFPLINFCLGKGIQITKDRAVNYEKDLAFYILICGVLCNLMLLGVFKYYDFIISNLGEFVFHSSPRLLELILPLGISFYTFQGISYLVDIYRGRLSGHNSIIDILLLISFFPHLVAGPIVRGADFLPQLQRPKSSDQIEAPKAFRLIIFGLFKKVVVAASLGSLVVDPFFDSPINFSALDALIGIMGYAVQIYCDFSAYSDMATGFAALLGYEFPNNFNQPYRATSLQDFWRRWHISLSNWLRDYLYVSLGGSRNGNLKTYRNLILTMALGGLWHGASWNFLAWGMLHGVGLSIERIFGWQNKNYTNTSTKVLATTTVFVFICIGWVFFRSSDFEHAQSVFASLLVWNGKSALFSPFVGLMLFVGMGMHFVSDHVVQWVEVGLSSPMATAFAMGVAIFLIVAMGTDGTAPFIYFRF